MEQKASQEDRFLCGRQIAFMIYEYFRVTGTHETVLDVSDLVDVILRGKTTSKDLTRDGTESCCQPGTFRRTKFCKPCTKCGLESVIISVVRTR